MTTKKVGLLSLVCLVAGLMSTGRLFGQAATASISGTVTDTSGAAVPGAVIEIRNTGTGTARTVVSDSQGRYSVPDLGIGTYEVRVSKTGFQTAVRSGLILTVGSAPVLDLQLSLGQTQETVTVEANAAQVETTNSAVSALVYQMVIG